MKINKAKNLIGDSGTTIKNDHVGTIFICVSDLLIVALIFLGIHAFV